jgi:anti-anti-sigma factor
MCDLKTRLYWIEGVGRPPTALLLCSGEIDLSNIDRLEQALGAAIETEAPVVEVDLRKVEFLDSSTIELLLSTYQKLITEGRTLRLQAGPVTWRLIHMLGLEGVLDARTPGPRDLTGSGEGEHPSKQSPIVVSEQSTTFSEAGEPDRHPAMR